MNRIVKYIKNYLHDVGVINSLKYFYSRLSNKWELIFSCRFGYKFVPFSLGGFFWLAGLKELKTVSWFNRNIANYDLFVNVGAGWGEYALMALAKHVPALIFEPNPSLNYIIRFNLDLNHYKESTDYWLFRCAIGTPKRREKFIVQTPFGTSHLKGYGRDKFEKLTVIEVNVIPLGKFEHLIRGYDNLFFLIDVEGAEIEVLRSIPKRIRDKADFIIESEKNQVEALSILLKGRRRYKLETHPVRETLGNYIWIKR